MKCYECGNVRRCRMVLTEVRDAEPPRTTTEYLCARCARLLSYTTPSTTEDPIT
jgi:hypothetical protein